MWVYIRIQLLILIRLQIQVRKYLWVPNFENQKYVFIKVKDKHQYDLNPKLVKFFLSEMLKEEKNRAKLYSINKKLDNLVKEKVIKFGLQQYFNVMDEIVSMLETNLDMEEENIKLYHKDSSIQKQQEEHKYNNVTLLAK